MSESEFMVKLLGALGNARDALQRQGDELERSSLCVPGTEYVRKQNEHARKALDRAIAILGDVYPEASRLLA